MLVEEAVAETNGELVLEIEVEDRDAEVVEEDGTLLDRVGADVVEEGEGNMLLDRLETLDDVVIAEEPLEGEIVLDGAL